MRRTVLIPRFFVLRTKGAYTALAGLIIMRIYYGILPCAKTCRIYMFALHKPGEEPFSEVSEAVVLLSVRVLSGFPVGSVYRSNLQTTSLRVL